MSQNQPEANSPTKKAAEGLNPALTRNIDAIMERRRESARSASLEERAAAAISKFAGSMMFVYIHIVFFGLWIGINVGWLPIIPPWDPSLVVLAMEASVEAIFLSTFVLINQNRMAAEDNIRADLDLQVSLLNEHETTRLIELVSAIARKLDIHTEADDELSELERDVSPEAVMDRIADAEEKAEV
ncbi:DUF1003 domain-containing protein [Devosia sp. 1635]|uniref:DUF1003 domain-containing protein n=1 Tax=Devosia sp. 1635 TaxID=2726066 RepID=UPI0015660811|nr:DUF1003 domain-containing protein [Devosia sp. 1635]